MTRAIWNARFSAQRQGSFAYDGWLDKHRDLLDEWSSHPCLDLGCGAGQDTAYLSGIGMTVFSTDHSINALNHAKAGNPKGLFLADLRSIPVSENSVGTAVANLSLHYFDEREVRKIANAIRTILRPGGYLFLRVNSIIDRNYGADGTPMNVVDGIAKYYYTPDMLRDRFEMFVLVRISEYATTCYGKPKNVVEAVLQKARGPISGV